MEEKEGGKVEKKEKEERWKRNKRAEWSGGRTCRRKRITGSGREDVGGGWEKARLTMEEKSISNQTSERKRRKKGGKECLGEAGSLLAHTRQ